MTGSATARRMWQALEVLHMTVYFAPEPRDAFRRAGLRGGWMGYFASRSAAMGPVPAEVVAATFYNFHPRMVHRAIPDAWGFATPAEVLAARYQGADAALGRLLGGWADGPEAAEAAALARRPRRAATRRAGPCSPPTPPCPGRTGPTWPCGTRPRSTASSAATATSPACWPRASTAARPTSWPPAPARPRGRSCASTGAGRRRTGRRPRPGWGAADGSRATVCCPRPAGRPGPPWSSAPTTWPWSPGATWARRAAPACSNCSTARPAWSSRPAGCRSPTRSGFRHPRPDRRRRGVPECGPPRGCWPRVTAPLPLERRHG